MRSWFGLLLAVAALVVFAPARAAAEDEKKPVNLSNEDIKAIKEALGKKTPEGKTLAEKFDAKEVPHERSMFECALDLGIWTLLVFLILFFVLYKYAWGPMLQGLDKREKEIAAAVEELKKARDEAAKLRQQLADEQKKGIDKINQMIDEARRDADRLKEQRKAEAEVEITAERDRLRREITMAKDQALKEIWAQSAELAALISAKAVRRQLNEADHRNLVDEALTDMRRAAEESRQALSGSHA